MNKKMFIICALFVLISSCKTDESKEEKSLENILDDIGLEVEKLVQADVAPKQARNKDGGAGAAQAGAGVVGEAGGAAGGVAGAGGGAAGGGGAADGAGGGGAAGAGAGVGGVGGAGVGAAGGGDNIKNQIAELKAKIEKADPKKTSLTTYSTYEGELKKLREALKGNENGANGGNDAELKQLEDSLKTKKDDRKKELEDYKNKFKGFKARVAAATGVTEGDEAKNKGRIGQQASIYAKQLGLNVKINNSSNDTKELVNQVIDGALKKIQEELESK
ncbi:hypothetical protein [Borreliella lusitaniae]|uniref:hypothetical protein n=1 Tax=Borreliella lusitaniae TaxID=100177 RepID=UPI003AB59170